MIASAIPWRTTMAEGYSSENAAGVNAVTTNKSAIQGSSNMRAELPPAAADSQTTVSSKAESISQAAHQAKDSVDNVEPHQPFMNISSEVVTYSPATTLHMDGEERPLLASTESSHVRSNEELSDHKTKQRKSEDQANLDVVLEEPDSRALTPPGDPKILERSKPGYQAVVNGINNPKRQKSFADYLSCCCCFKHGCKLNRNGEEHEQPTRPLELTQSEASDPLLTDSAAPRDDISIKAETPLETLLTSKGDEPSPETGSETDARNIYMPELQLHLQIKEVDHKKDVPPSNTYCDESKNVKETIALVVNQTLGEWGKRIDDGLEPGCPGLPTVNPDECAHRIHSRVNVKHGVVLMTIGLPDDGGIAVVGPNAEAYRKDIYNALEDMNLSRLYIGKIKIGPDGGISASLSCRVTKKKLEASDGESDQSVSCELIVRAQDYDSKDRETTTKYACVPAHLIFSMSYNEGYLGNWDISQIREHVGKQMMDVEYEFKNENEEEPSILQQPPLLAYRHWDRGSASTGEQHQSLSGDLATSEFSDKSEDPTTFMNDIALLKFKKYTRDTLANEMQVLAIPTKQHLELLAKRKQRVFVGDLEGMLIYNPRMSGSPNGNYGQHLSFIITTKDPNDNEKISELPRGSSGLIVFFKGMQGQLIPVGMLVGKISVDIENFGSSIYQAIVLSQALNEIEQDYPQQISDIRVLETCHQSKVTNVLTNQLTMESTIQGGSGSQALGAAVTKEKPDVANNKTQKDSAVELIEPSAGTVHIGVAEKSRIVSTEPKEKETPESKVMSKTAAELVVQVSRDRKLNANEDVRGAAAGYSSGDSGLETIKESDDAEQSLDEDGPKKDSSVSPIRPSPAAGTYKKRARLEKLMSTAQRMFSQWLKEKSSAENSQENAIQIEEQLEVLIDVLDQSMPQQGTPNRRKRAAKRKRAESDHSSKKRQCEKSELKSVWYRHSGQPVVDDIPHHQDCNFRTFKDEREILEDIGTHHITHMYIRDGDILSLELVAPKVRALKVTGGVSRLLKPSQLESLKSLTELKELYIETVNLSGGLPPVISQLTSLEKLELSWCKLTDLPESMSSLSNLKYLDLHNNDFSKGLPDVIAQLRSLETLILYNCELSNLPERLSKLGQLTSLSLQDNDLVDIPCVFNLKSLNMLDVSRNHHLSTLDGIMQLTQLVELNCEDCASLAFPAYGFCQQGLAAVRQYFTDLSSAQGVELSVVPVSIVGEKLAGKTSLVQSLQTGQRSLTYRSNSSPLDETTKVFEVNDLQLENALVKLIDHGGHEVYHITYRYILKERNIPLVVVSMEEFSNLSSKCGPKEAVKRICLDWLSHLYLPSPLLGPPILVFTHADKLTTSITQCQQDFLQLAEVVREEMLAEEAAQWGQDGHLNQILHWSNREVPLFSPEDVFVFSDDKSETANIDALKARLESRCVKFKTLIPRLWEDVGKFVDGQKAKPFIALSDILSKYPGDDCLVILRYMHNTGSILWFEHTEHLNQYIFHRIPEMTAMIAVLFHHRSEDEWKKRLDTFTAFRHGKDMIDRDEYKKLYEVFTTTGILDEAILMRLLEKESRFPPTVALELLQCFGIVHGPIKRCIRDAYVIPYFATTRMGDSWKTDGSLQLRLDIKLHGLPLPMYAYQLSTVAVLNKTMNPINTTTVTSDGVTIYHGESATHLIHRSYEKKITLQVSTTLEQLGDSWKRLLDTAKTILEMLSHVWIACRPSILVYCSHCLFLRDAQPYFVVNPEWFRPVFEGSSRENTSSVVNMCHYTGAEPVICKRDAAIHKNLRPTVPKPLLFPCYHLTDDEIDKVNDYLTDIKYNRLTNSKDREQQPSPTYRLRWQAADDVMSDLSDVEESGYCDESAQVKITTRLKAVRGHKMKVRYNKDERIYWMSDRVRCRAMIIDINRTLNGGEYYVRDGSDVDYDNISRLFTDLRFDIVKSKPQLTNLSVQEIYSEIEEETQKEIHKTLSLFVFIILTTGQKGDILADCYGQPVDLMKVKDLLSSANFPAMRGKPKLLIVQSCLGDRYVDVAVLDETPSLPSTATVDLTAPSTATVDLTVPSAATVDLTVPSTATVDLTVPSTSTVVSSVPSTSTVVGTTLHRPVPTDSGVDDFMIMYANSESSVAIRSHTHGSWFIRILVETFYKHAHSRDVESLFKIIQERVKQVSLTSPMDANVPSSVSSLRRKLFLFPGYPVFR